MEPDTPDSFWTRPSGPAGPDSSDPGPWPDFPPAPESDIGALARRWLKDGDWSAVGPLTDALRDAGREADAAGVKAQVAHAAHEEYEGRRWAGEPVPYYATTYPGWKDSALRLLWWDLFDFCGCITMLAKETP